MLHFVTGSNFIGLPYIRTLKFAGDPIKNAKEDSRITYTEMYIVYS